jgi:hypothetical protein
MIPVMNNLGVSTPISTLSLLPKCQENKLSLKLIKVEGYSLKLAQLLINDFLLLFTTKVWFEYPLKTERKIKYIFIIILRSTLLVFLLRKHFNSSKLLTRLF